MGKPIEAVFDGAVLRPAEPLLLEPNTRVWIVVETMRPRNQVNFIFANRARAQVRGSR